MTEEQTRAAEEIRSAELALNAALMKGAGCGIRAEISILRSQRLRDAFVTEMADVALSIPLPRSRAR